MSWQWSWCYRSARDTEPQIKEERILQVTTRCRFLPSCVRLAPTHPPLRSLAHTILVYTHVNIPTCTHKRQLHASSNRLPLFTLLLLFSSPGSRPRRFSFSSPPGDGSFYCARAPGNRNPMAVGYTERISYIFSFSSSNLVAFSRRCFDQFVREAERETAGDKINFKRAERVSFARSGKRKRRTKESSGPYGLCRYTFSPFWKAWLLWRTQKLKRCRKEKRTREESAYDYFGTREICRSWACSLVSYSSIRIFQAS